MYKWILKISEYWTKGNIIGWPDICRPNRPKIFHFVQYSLFIQYSLIHDLALNIYCVTVFIFKLWFTVKILCIQTFYRVESDWVNNNLEIGIQVIIFSSLVCEEYPSFTSQGGVFLWLTDWYVISFLKSQQKSEQISSYKQHK